MRHGTILTILLLAAWAGPSAAAEARGAYNTMDRADAASSNFVHGGVVGYHGARQDSIDVLGGSLDDGDFEDFFYNADPDGWTSVDLTAQSDPVWHVDTYRATNLGGPGNHAMWCGTSFPETCGDWNTEGYGNDWDKHLVWTLPVPDPQLESEIQLQAILNVDVEPGADRLSLELQTASAGWQEILALDGRLMSHVVDEYMFVAADDYVGDFNDEIRLRWRFRSDAQGSDEDCLWPSRGAAQIDNIQVDVLGVTTTFDDFESGPGNWVPTPSTGVGDFALARDNGYLEGFDFAHWNSTPRFAFIDDGVVVPGTGGSYGPLPYYYWGVNAEGGLLGPDYGIHNEIRSPVVDWPAGNDGGRLAFDLFTHLPPEPGSPDIYAYWKVRSTASGDPADLATAPWRSDGVLYYTAIPSWQRLDMDVTAYLVPGKTHVQVALGVIELNPATGGDDPAPASPQYDNVRLQAFPHEGPALVARKAHLAQDAFPASGTLDFGAPHLNAVRFDMARNVGHPDLFAIVPGDSLVVDIVAARTGSVLNGMPRLHYALSANPEFAPYRTSGLPDEGWIDGDFCRNQIGQPIADRYCFDLPDAGFFFPGDVLHYYVEAVDDLLGDMRTALLPADTTGFGDFETEGRYDASFVVRALPSLFTLTPGDQPPLLFINDSTLDGNENDWRTSLLNLGLRCGVDYDLFRVQEAASGIGNGIGSRCTPAQLDHYETVLYTSGDHASHTLNGSDFLYGDGSGDLACLHGWLTAGDRNLFLCGSGLVHDLESSPEGDDFCDWLGVKAAGGMVYDIFESWHEAMNVETIPPLGLPVFTQHEQWAVLTDALWEVNERPVEIVFPAERLAYYTRAPEYSPYSAATLCGHSGNISVLSLPYDLCDVIPPYGADKSVTPSSVRTRMLEDVLTYFGHGGGSEPPSRVPDLFLSEAVTAATEPVVVATSPGAGGHRLDQALAFGPVVTDATVTVTLRDEFGDPIPGYPAEDIWLEADNGGSYPCPGGSTADHDTDHLGQTTFSGQIPACGTPTTELDGLVAVVDGLPLEGSSLPIRLLSSDYDGDLAVTIFDVAQLRLDYLDPQYQARTDFFWDGELTLSDIVLFRSGLNMTCGLDLLPSIPTPSPEPLPSATVGLYFDRAGTQQTVEMPPGVPVDAYVLVIPDAQVEVGGASAAVDFGPLIVFDEEFTELLTMDNPLGGFACAPGCQPAGPANPVTIRYVALTATTNERTAITILGAPDNLPPIYTDCGGWPRDGLNTTTAYFNPCNAAAHGLSLDYSASGNFLVWSYVADDMCDPDYRIHRDVAPGFTPSPANLVHTTRDAQWLDETGTVDHYYRVVVAINDYESAPVAPEVLAPPLMTAEPPFTPDFVNEVAWDVAGPEYLCQCAADAEFTVDVRESGWIADGQYTFVDLPEGEVLHYRVKARNAELESDWSNVVSSTQDDTPPDLGVDPLPPYHTVMQLDVPYTATDEVSGVVAVDLYYSVESQVPGPFGWEDGVSTVLGFYPHGDPIIATNTDEMSYSGGRCLRLEDNEPSGTPQAFVAWIQDLQDGDVVTAGFWRFDDSPGAPPHCRIWANWNDYPGDIYGYSGTAGGNPSYGPGEGWDYVEHAWTVADGHTGLVVQARTYSQPGDVVWIDDLQVDAPEHATVTLPDAGPRSEFVHYGTFTGSPIRFTAPVEGDYHFYTVATDAVGNVEDPPALAPDRWTRVVIPTDVPGETPQVRVTALHQNAPNPFNPATTIRFDLPRATRASLAIFDVTGARVRTLIDGEVVDPGRHEMIWRGVDDAGRAVASGMYCYQLRAGNFVQTRRMVLIR